MLHGTRIEHQGNIIPILTGASRFIHSVLRSRSNGVTIMTTEDKSQMPLFSPEDEKETQKTPDHNSTNGRLKATNNWTGFQGKTMWDWLQLLGVLAIPLVVAGATLLFGLQQANLANQQHENDQKIANQQHEAEQKQALDQQQAAILQTYIDNIQDLLLNHNLLKSQVGDDVALLARARTLTALRGLDPQRKGILLQFLYEARLIGFKDYAPDKKTKQLVYIIRPAIIRLNGADLSGIILASHESLISISGVDLAFTNMRGANLSWTFLDGANLIGTHLEGANLSHTNLRNADIFSHLTNSNLQGANLEGANLYSTDLQGADLSYSLLDCFISSVSILPPTKCTDLKGTNITQQQLDQAHSCKGASLPKGLICHNK
jgi:uncharacterized protein YjbI with pentapeptide repeats